MPVKELVIIFSIPFIHNLCVYKDILHRGRDLENGVIALLRNFVTSQKIYIFTDTVVRTSKLTLHIEFSKFHDI